MMGTFKWSSSAAAMMPWAMTSHRIMPPKMFTKIACTWECKTSFQIKIAQACLDYEIKKVYLGENGCFSFYLLNKKPYVNLQFNMVKLMFHCAWWVILWSTNKKLFACVYKCCTANCCTMSIISYNLCLMKKKRMRDQIKITGGNLLLVLCSNKY